MASLHSRWSSGDLIFYDGTQDIFRIKNSTGGLVVGEDDEGVDLKFYGDTTGAYFHFDESADLVDFHNIKITYGAPQKQTSTTGGTITLNAASNRIQFLSSTASFHTVVPSSTGTGVPGIEFKIFNTSSTGDISVWSGSTGGTLFATIGKLEGAVLVSGSTGWRSIIGST